jgi:hypothetical protein
MPDSNRGMTKAKRWYEIEFFRRFTQQFERGGRSKQIEGLRSPALAATISNLPLY